jgi:hypothetical protein
MRFTINQVSGMESGVATSFCHRTPNGFDLMGVLWDYITILVVEKHCNAGCAESPWSAVAKSDATPLFVRKNETFEKTQILVVLETNVCRTLGQSDSSGNSS